MRKSSTCAGRKSSTGAGDFKFSHDFNKLLYFILKPRKTRIYDISIYRRGGTLNQIAVVVVVVA